MIDIQNLNFPIAFLAGFLTFVAPCVLPILPAYIGYISGVGLQDREEGKKHPFKSKTFKNSLFFVFGFLLVFIILGLFARTAGVFLNTYQRPVQIVGGILFLFLGSHLAGLYSLNVFHKHAQVHVSNHLTRFQYLNAFLVGLTFGFGWTPCIGPVLAVILFWASQSDTFWRGFFMLLSFGLGLGIPFLLLSLFTEQMMSRLRKMGIFFRRAQIIAGILVMIFGVLLIFDLLGPLVAPLTQYGTLEMHLIE